MKSETKVNITQENENGRRTDITEAKAKDWCEAKVGEDQLKVIEASLDAQIAEKETPTRGTGRPWAS